MSTPVYTNTAIRLHWLMTVMIIGLFGLGIYMHDLPLSPTKLQLYSWHKWIGVTVFVLALIRILWRFGHRPPELPAHMQDWEKLLAHAAHFALYFLMLAVPLSGWLMSSAKGFQTVWFGVLPLPDLLDKNEELGELLEKAHFALNLIFAATIFAHLAAAYKHHLIDKDDVMARMIPRLAAKRNAQGSK